MHPDIIITYPVHGVSGFHDHLVTHAVVKRLYLEMKESGADYLQRLAFLTLPDSGEPVFQDSGFRMKQSSEEWIDCIIPLQPENIDMMIKCLNCYKTYQETITESDVVEKVGDKVYFEIYGENFTPVINDLTAGLE